MSIPLFGEVLSASIAYFFLITPSLFFDQIPENFGQFLLVDLKLHILHCGGWWLTFDTYVWWDLFWTVHLADFVVILVHLFHHFNLIYYWHVYICSGRYQSSWDGTIDLSTAVHDLIWRVYTWCTVIWLVTWNYSLWNFYSCFFVLQLGCLISDCFINVICKVLALCQGFILWCE